MPPMGGRGGGGNTGGRFSEAVHRHGREEKKESALRHLQSHLGSGRVECSLSIPWFQPISETRSLAVVDAPKSPDAPGPILPATAATATRRRHLAICRQVRQSPASCPEAGLCRFGSKGPGNTEKRYSRCYERGLRTCPENGALQKESQASIKLWIKCGSWSMLSRGSDEVRISVFLDPRDKKSKIFQLTVYCPVSSISLPAFSNLYHSLNFINPSCPSTLSRSK